MYLGMYMGPKDVVGENRLKEWGNVASLKDTSIIYLKFSIRWVGGGNSLKENRLIRISRIGYHISRKNKNIHNNAKKIFFFFLIT
jgi:hypothetical protein